MLKFIKLKHTKAIKKPPKHGYSSKNHVWSEREQILRQYVYDTKFNRIFRNFHLHAIDRTTRKSIRLLFKYSQLSDQRYQHRGILSVTFSVILKYIVFFLQDIGCQVILLVRYERVHYVLTLINGFCYIMQEFSYLRGFEFSSPPVSINSVLPDVCTLPWTVYETWFYYFSSLDVQWFINT